MQSGPARWQDGAMLPTPRPRHAALAAGLALAALPAAASADSIVYIKDANVWLADGDGGGQYQVTLDGTAQQPYRVPVQADDGTIVASHRSEIVRMRQNGQELGRIDPDPLVNSVSHPVDGPPVNLAVSPDGSRIAYSLVGYECPVGADCMARAVTAFTAPDALTPAAQWGSLYRSDPSFVSGTRSLVFGGYGGQVNVHDLGDPAETHWFDDYDVYGQADATDLGDGELNRQGTRLAAIRSYGADAHLIWYATGGDAATAKPPAVPAPLCRTGAVAGVAGPTWAPDGERHAFAAPDGIWTARATADCAAAAPALLIAGASQPDWGPADVNPGPRGGGSNPGGGPGGGGSSAAPTLTVKRTRAKRIARRGAAVTVGCAAACAVKAELLVDRRSARRLGLKRGRPAATAKRTLASAGTAKLTLKPLPKLRKRFGRLRGAKLTVRVTVTDASGATQVLRRRL
jgi:hypothetical protein